MNMGEFLIDGIWTGIKFCILCQETNYGHVDVLDHPFFDDNLKYLEWKANERSN
jgi:hypothetical protein